ncbi:MAG: hypothetical protein U0T82_10600 [Bacteroidales bacterium]
MIIAFFVMIMLIVTPIYAPWFNHRLYLGQWSPNIWHNPTIFIVKPFAILTVFIYAKWLGSQSLERKSELVFLSIMIFMSLLAKPSFLFSFIPSLFFYYLFRITKYPIKHYAQAFLAFLPSLFLIVWQYYATYQSNQSGSDGLRDTIIFTWWGVIKLFTPNVFISFLLALAFPLFVLFTDFKKAFKDHYLLLAWLNTLVAYSEASFLAEKVKFGMGNFTFGYSLSLAILFVFSLIHFQNYCVISKRIIQAKIVFMLGWILLGAHFISGAYYYYQYLVIHSFA